MSCDQITARPRAVPKKLARAQSSVLALMIACGFAVLAPSVAHADEASEIKQLRKLIEQQQQQLQVQQQKLDALAAAQSSTQANEAAVAAQATAATQAATAATAAASNATATASNFSIANSKVKVTLGGFAAAETVDRTRNETADIGSSFSGLPLPNSTSYHTGEFRGTARQSRLSILAEGNVSDDMKLAAYMESDFLGAAGSANSNQSNSYQPRIRVFYSTLDLNNYGLHILGGQSWSLLTMNKVGIQPRQEDIPLTIDASYVPGFSWARQWGLRAVEDLDPNTHIGLSIEEPQTTFYASPNGNVATGVVNNNLGGSQLDPTASYSTDVAPDVIAKLAADPGWGHYEAYGVARFFHNQIGATGLNGGTNKVVLGGGVGAGAILPLIPQGLELHFSTLVGNGIGRYGAAGLSDVTTNPAGEIAPIPEIQAMVGLTGHPDPSLDLYAYAGVEKAERTDFIAGGKGYGYGSELYNNTGCYTIGGTCTANTSAIAQGTIGGWWKFYKGSYGTMQVGLQDSFTERYVFSGVGGAPHVNDNMLFTSLRYYPF